METIGSSTLVTGTMNPKGTTRSAIHDQGTHLSRDSNIVHRKRHKNRIEGDDSSDLQRRPFKLKRKGEFSLGLDSVQSSSLSSKKLPSFDRGYHRHSFEPRSVSVFSYGREPFSSPESSLESRSKILAKDKGSTTKAYDDALDVRRALLESLEARSAMHHAMVMANQGLSWISRADYHSVNIMRPTPGAYYGVYPFSGTTTSSYLQSLAAAEASLGIEYHLAAVQRLGLQQQAGILAHENMLQLSSVQSEQQHQTAEPEQHQKEENSVVALGIDEDSNWLSEFQCFIRSELVEVFRANHQDVRDRKATRCVALQQVGIRCKFCAHMPLDKRAPRSSAFPSSVAQMYQSFIMVVREHFTKCTAIPEKTKANFLELQGRNTQGDCNSKGYWKYSAAKLGMVDSGVSGITVTQESLTKALIMPPFGTSLESAVCGNTLPSFLVAPKDADLISEYLFLLMSQVQRVELLPSECKGFRKTLKPGLPGFGCRHCCQVGRYGLCRVFPVIRRTLPDKAYGFADHLKRCRVCPPEIKNRLDNLFEKEKISSQKANKMEKRFFDQVWRRLGK